MTEAIKAAPKYYNATRDAVLAKLKHDHAGNGIMYRLYGFATLLVIEHGTKVGSDHLANLLAMTHEAETIGDSTARSIKRFPGQMLKLLKATEGLEGAPPRMPATATVDDVVAWVVAARDYVGAKRAAEMSTAIDAKLTDLEAAAARALMPDEPAEVPAAPYSGTPAPEAASPPPAPELSAHEPPQGATGSAPAPAKPKPALPPQGLMIPTMALVEQMDAEQRYNLILAIVGTLSAETIAHLAEDLATIIAPPAAETVPLAEAA